MKVIKRSGKEVKFDVSKIKAAIEKANINTIENQRLSDEQVDHCVKEVETKLSKISLVCNTYKLLSASILFFSIYVTTPLD